MPKNTNKQIDTERRAECDKRLKRFSECGIEEICTEYDFCVDGFGGEDDSDAIKASRDQYGANRVTGEKKPSVLKRLFEAFINPFSLILVVLVGVMLVVGILDNDVDLIGIIIVGGIVLLSGTIRFIQETKSSVAAEKLAELVENTTAVIRGGQRTEIPLDEVVVGDIIRLAAGDIIPADMRIFVAKDLFVGQSQLTGESEPIEKFGTPQKDKPIIERNNLVFMGSSVVSGSAVAIVAAVGDDTILGQTAKVVQKKAEKSNFEKGISSVSKLLVYFMLAMVPVVFLVNGFTSGNWFSAFLFGIAIAVGLTPEMLPMIITACLAKGATMMAKKKTIIKDLDSIQNFGAMDVLCTDKTGTLTMDKVVLQKHLNVFGQEDPRVLKHAFLNSHFQTGLKNLMDLSIIEKTDELAPTTEMLAGLVERYKKIDEIPFDFVRRRMSVVVQDDGGKRQLITKGAVEEMLAISKFVEIEGQIEPLTDELKKRVLRTVDGLNGDGMRVIGVAQKTTLPSMDTFGVADESEMVLFGYLAFLDPPKESTADAILALKKYGVDVKILTGDNDKVTLTVCKQVGLQVTGVLLGADLETLNDTQLREKVEKVNVFAKLSPSQKSRVVQALRDNGHIVGYMGDGINDAAAMRTADVGISVDTAVDIAKEAAHIILLEKDLMVLEEGIIEGRKVYANMVKYIKITVSSNFGNMFSVLAASAFLPFLPMLPTQLILINLVYDLSCTALPWDNVDKEFLLKPRAWESASVAKFMFWIGPTSSVFDISTYLLLYLFICPQMFGGQYNDLTPETQEQFVRVFQAGWLVESIWTQTLVLHILRTAKMPFAKSRASFVLTTITGVCVVVVSIVPYTIVGELIGLSPFPPVFYAWLLLTVAAYFTLASVVKHFYVKRYGELL
ncbi:MAG: magnesium-translocating P-type ATPase [Firmicutes bacterium]|nr:magnesium-translocating P-type ATPase [Bacillota bacterium]